MIEDREKEFWDHLWNHSEDEFQREFDTGEVIGSEIAQAIIDITLAHDRSAKRERLTEEVKRNPEFIHKVLQVVGGTRSKIISDLKASGVDQVPGKPVNLIKSPLVWRIAADYLLDKLDHVLEPIHDIPEDGRAEAIEIVFRATWQGWIRQERAKRQGHEAEGRLARLLRDLGLPFEPKEKATNPLCPDVVVNGVSFDLVFPDVESFQVGVMSTVHTSNIGQYGESKDGGDMQIARNMVDGVLSGKARILAVVDGVGFLSNKAGLGAVLNNCDEFSQFKSMWKAAIVAASAAGVNLELDLSDANEHAHFLERYSHAVTLKKSDDTPGWIDAGEGRLRNP